MQCGQIWLLATTRKNAKIATGVRLRTARAGENPAAVSDAFFVAGSSVRSRFFLMLMSNYLFTSESVSAGHPDKVADQISDAIVDEFLARDPSSKVACETLVTTGQVVVAGEVRSDAYIDIQETARRVIRQIGYDRSELRFDGDSCGILSAIHEQSADIL